jgi:hypothetical protein
MGFPWASQWTYITKSIFIYDITFIFINILLEKTTIVTCKFTVHAARHVRSSFLKNCVCLFVDNFIIQTFHCIFTIGDTLSCNSHLLLLCKTVINLNIKTLSNSFELFSLLYHIYCHKCTNFWWFLYDLKCFL